MALVPDAPSEYVNVARFSGRSSIPFAIAIFYTIAVEIVNLSFLVWKRKRMDAI